MRMPCTGFYDRNNDGQLSLDEFISALRRDAKLTAEMLPDRAVAQLFGALDRDHSKSLDVQEFVAW